VHLPLTHSRALAAAIVALSTCAGATRMAAVRAPEPEPERVAFASAPAAAPGDATAATLAPAPPRAAQ
jgi:hypothetical protein